MFMDMLTLVSNMLAPTCAKKIMNALYIGVYSGLITVPDT